MNEVTRARVQLFAVLLIIIIAAHILLIKLFVFNRDAETERGGEPVAAAPAQTAEAKAEALTASPRVVPANPQTSGLDQTSDPEAKIIFNQL